MMHDQAERTRKQRAARFHAVPWRSTGGMRERDHVEGESMPVYGEFCSDHFGQLIECHILLDRELADGQHERGRSKSNSASSHFPQVAISPGSGTRSPPAFVFPGKQRATAAM
jgi:hypothetical protein